MGLFDLFKSKKAPITEWAGLADFVDANAAFLVNRSFWEYARARAGLNSTALFHEKEFQAAVEDGRWKAFPLTVTNLAQLVEGELRPRARGREAALLDAILKVTDGVLSRYPLPAGFADDFFETSKAEVAAHLRMMVGAPPKPVADILDATFPRMFDLVPLHPIVRQHDYEVVRNNVRGQLLNMLDRFRAEADADALIAALPRT